MPDYDNTNKGILFTNDRKESEKHPDFTGKLDVNGKEYQLAAWNRTSKNGKNFLSVSISEPRQFDQRPESEQPQQQVSAWKRPTPRQDTVIEDIGNEPINLDDIPF